MNGDDRVSSNWPLEVFEVAAVRCGLVHRRTNLVAVFLHTPVIIEAPGDRKRVLMSSSSSSCRPWSPGENYGFALNSRLRYWVWLSRKP